MVQKKEKKLDKRGLRKDNFIYENFKIAFNDLKKIKSYFWFSFVLFFFIGLIGFLFPIFFKEQILKIIESLIEKTKSLDTLELIRFIIINNMQSAFVGMFFGIFLGIIPLSIIIVNAYILGFVANKTVGMGSILILWRLLPHGIFELPAILISVSLGLRLGFLLMYDCITSRIKEINNLRIGLLMFLSVLFFPVAFLIYIGITLFNKRLKKKLWVNIKDSFRIFVFVVIPLLVIAGIIEGVLIELVG